MNSLYPIEFTQSQGSSSVENMSWTYGVGALSKLTRHLIKTCEGRLIKPFKKIKQTLYKSPSNPAGSLSNLAETL